MATQPITIIGGGIGGLTLGRCLLRHGIKSIIYEKSPNKPRHNYGITLHSSTYNSLSYALQTTPNKVDPTHRTSEFRETVAVDAEVGGTGKLDVFEESDIFKTSMGFRVNRWKLEEYLKKGLDVRYEHTVQDIKTSQHGGPTEIQFASGEVVRTDLLIGADGPHSVVRKTLLPHVQMEVLPLVAYNGKRKISGEVWAELFEPAMRETNVLQEKHGDALLNVSVNERKEDEISISWTYSRPPRGEDDKLHRPERANADAKSIPEDLFQEIGALGDLKQPFREIFEPEKLRKDRILHWLMRRTLIPLSDLQDLFSQKKIVLLGDAAHAEPIIGGNGANSAILDSIQLANKMVNAVPIKIKMAGWKKGNDDIGYRLTGLPKRYNTAYPYWEKAQKENEERMWNMHGVEREQANL